jgi:hypothetical protein
MAELYLLLLLVAVLFIAQLFPRRFLNENFETQQNGTFEPGYPQCSYETASEYNIKKRELDVLLQKMEDIRMDLTQRRGRIYHTIDTPYSTEQDIEPAATLVGRCQRKLLRQRDIELATDRYLTRGNQLIDGINAYFPSATATARSNLKTRVISLKTLMLEQCITAQPQLDMPEGVRDPAFYEPPKLEELRATSTFMNVQ